jgi:transketolase
MAARRIRGLMDPDAPAATSPFDHHVYVFASDGDIEEGITHEASALAGHQKLGNLIVLYDDNDISIEDDTAIAKSEDVCARYEAYGWHVQRVSFRQPGGYREDVQALHGALLAARDHTQAPSFIALSTIIGWPAPSTQNTGSAHGSALGADEVAATKEILHFDPAVSFPVEQDAVDHARDVADRGKRAHARWDEQFARWAAAQPERKALLDRLAARGLPDGWASALPVFEPDAKGVATRKASGEVLNALARVLPELQIALAAREALQQDGIAARVVSMPSVEWFAAQDDSYQQEVLPARVRARVSVEAGIALGWRGFVGDAGECVGLEHFGESADYQALYREFGITAEHVMTAAKASLARVRAR